MAIRHPTLPNDAGSITPSDDTAISHACFGLYVGGAGDLSVVTEYGYQHRGTDAPAVVFKDVPAGTVLPVAIHRVNSTGTTATEILGLR